MNTLGPFVTLVRDRSDNEPQYSITRQVGGLPFSNIFEHGITLNIDWTLTRELNINKLLAESLTASLLSDLMPSDLVRIAGGYLYHVEQLQSLLFEPFL